MMVLKRYPEAPLAPGEILASVPKPAAIARAEKHLAMLRQIRDTLADLAAAAANADAQRGPGLPPSAEARQIASDQISNARDLDEARRKLAEASTVYVAALKSAIAP